MYLSLFDPELPSSVMADASPIRLGAVLVERKEEDVRVICHVSNSLSSTERFYSETEKKTLS